jgi:hypothetical protein
LFSQIGALHSSRVMLHHYLTNPRLFNLKSTK